MGLFDNRVGEVITTIQSDSEPDVTYEIVIGGDNVIYCTCPGWMHSRKSPKCCKHLRAFAQNHYVLMVNLLRDKGVDAQTRAALLESFVNYDGKRL